MDELQYRYILADYEKVLTQVRELNRSIGVKPWTIEPWHDPAGNPHPEGSAEYEQFEAIVAHGRDLEARWREAGDRLDQARVELLAIEAAAAKAKRR